MAAVTMLGPNLIPTPLLQATQRAPMQIIRPAPLPRFRRVRIVLAFLKVLLGLAWLRLRGALTQEIAGRRVRVFLEDKGFLWIKVGQLLSLREDIFSPEFCRELSRLQFQARGFPFDMALQTLNEELGRPLEEVFSEFDEQPFAAASISQVHRAVLRRNGALVVVKVQRPDVPELFERDMALIRGLVDFAKAVHFMPFLRWDDLFWELNHIMLEELDYRYETSNLRRMRRNLRGHRIYVPQVFEDVSYQRVLVMEYIRGVLMSDFIAVRQSDPLRLDRWLEENQVDPRRVGRRLFLSFLRQLMEDNLFHGDLHPGNIVLLRDSRIAFIDLGTVGTVETDFLQGYMQSMRAVAEHKYHKAAELGLLLCPDIPPVDLAKLIERLVRAYRAWDHRSSLRGVPYNERSVMSMGNETSRVMSDQGVVVSMIYLRLARTWGTLDASLAYLLPEANYPRLIRLYFRQAAQRARRERGRARALLDSVLSTYTAATEVSAMVQPMLHQQALLFRGETEKYAYFFSALFRGLRLGVAVIAVGWCLRVLEAPLRYWLGDDALEGLIHRLGRIVPAPAEPAGQLLAGILLLAVYLALRRTERWLLKSGVRLPSTAIGGRPDRESL